MGPEATKPASCCGPSRGGSEPVAPRETEADLSASARKPGRPLLLPGAKVGEGRVEGTMPLIFSGDETTDLGSDLGTPVSDDYASADGAFTGVIEWVQIDVDDAAEDPDHLISPEERFRVAMARQ